MDAIFRNKFTVAFLTLTILIDFMGMAIVVVLFPKLLLGSNIIFSSLWSHNDRYIAMGLLMAVYPLGQIFGASTLGKLSDFYGRKKLLVLTLFGTLVGFMLSGVAVLIGSVTLLFSSRLLAGLCAGNVAIAQAGLIDISTDETKTKNISWGQLAMGSGYIIGPVLGAVLSNPAMVSWFSMSTPFWAISFILAGLIALTVTSFKETNLKPKREKINLLESFSQIYLGLISKQLRVVFGVWLLFVSGWWLFESFMPTYLMTSLNYSTTQIGTILSFNGILYASFQYIVVQRLAKNFKPANMFKFSTIFVALSIMSLTVISTILQLYIAMSVFVMAMGFAIPGIITFISNLADKNEQGQVMGIVNSIQAVSTVLVMISAGYLYAININIAIIISGVLVILSCLCFISLLVKKKLQVATN
ncbi:MAG: MFS transporter [Gammaproteobacteria bacterium]|nr:MFS transporter [Gammaproteobacteria bacterium]